MACRRGRALQLHRHGVADERFAGLVHAIEQLEHDHVAAAELEVLQTLDDRLRVVGFARTARVRGHVGGPEEEGACGS